MSTHLTTSADISLHGAVQVAASVPYLLGFAPSASVVLVFASDLDRRLVVTGRLDLPHVAADFAAFLRGCEVTATSAVTAGATSVHVLMYPARRGPDESALAAEVCSTMQVAGLLVASWGCVWEGHWIDFDFPEGDPIELETQAAQTAFQWVANGISYATDRAQLAATVIGPPTVTTEAVRSVIETPPGLTCRSVTRTARERRALEEDMFVHLCDPWKPGSGGADPKLPSAEVLANWYLSLADRRVREPLMWRLARDRPDAVASIDRLAGLVRNCPQEVAAPVSSCLAAHAWQVGNGALAAIAAEHALDSDPRNVLADLVLRAVSRGVHPDVWVSMLASMTLRELRSSRTNMPSGS